MPPFIADTFHIDESPKQGRSPISAEGNPIEVTGPDGLVYEPNPKPLPRQVQILTDALALLRRDGWCQKTLWDTHNRSCIAGACIRTAGDETIYIRGWRRWWHKNMPYIQTPDQFNDTPSRTFAEIEDWFAKAIDLVIRRGK